MLSLVHKAMAADLRLSRVAAFSKRLLQMALAHQAPFACGCLVLLSNILEVRWPWEAQRQCKSSTAGLALASWP